MALNILGLDLEWKYKKHIEAYRANHKAKVRRRIPLDNDWSAQIKARIERGWFVAFNVS